MSTHRVVVKSAGVLGLLTSVSRVLGFIRDLVIATAFGTGVAAEAFVVSFKLPNLLRDLVGEGAANAAFVPILTECKEKKPEDYWGLVSALFYVMSAALLTISALGVWFAPQVVGLIAPGFVRSEDPEKLALTIHLTRIIFPYLFLIGLSALAMGVLNSLKEFTSSALGPILLNLSMITAGFYLEKSLGPLALVLGVLFGGVLQLTCQVPALAKKGFHLARPNFGHGLVKKTGKLLIPRVLGSALYQINVFVDTILASFEGIVGAGGQSALYYSNRLFQLPLAIVGISIAQAVLPTFSTQIVREDLKGFKETFSMAVRSVLFVVLPASAGLVMLCEPIVRIIFQRGEFNAYSTQITSSALFFYAFGLLSCCLIKLLANAFYAMHDTRTPVKTALFSVALNIALCLVLMRPLQIGGLTLASSISATVNAVLLYRILRKRVGPIEEVRVLKSFYKTLAAACVMGVFCYFYGAWFLGEDVSLSAWSQAAVLLGGILAAVIIYFVSALLLRSEEARKVLHFRSHGHS